MFLCKLLSFIIILNHIFKTIFVKIFFWFIKEIKIPILLV